MSFDLRQEGPKKVLRKRTAKGALSPRYVRALNAEDEAKSFEADRKTMFKKLSKAQIAREYTDKRVKALVMAAENNLKALRGPTRMESWMIE